MRSYLGLGSAIAARAGAGLVLAVAVTLCWTVTSTVRVSTVSAASPSISPAARALAGRLGVRAVPAIGNWPQGAGGPWYAWYRRSMTRADVTDGIILRRDASPSGKVLLTDARGARGKYHFFDPSQVSPFFGGLHAIRSRVISRRTAAQVATDWLRRAGTAVPASSVQVVPAREGCPAEEVFGDFYGQYAVYWGSPYTRQQDCIRSTGPVVWISTTGKVFEVDIGYVPHQVFSSPPSAPCGGSSATDSRGVSTGTWCFDYAHLVQGQIAMSSGIGWTDPRQALNLPAANRDPARLGIPILRTLSPSEAVWDQAYRGTAYRTVYVPAFPALIGSVWVISGVRSMSLRAAHISTLQARSTPPCPLTGSPTWLEERWVNGLGNSFTSTPPVHRIVRRVPSVRALYRSFCSLVRDSSDAVRMCPIDRGDLFHLTFHGRSKVLIRATVDMEGCSFVRAAVPGFSRFAYTPSQGFVDDLAAALGIPNNQLWPHMD